MQTKYWEKNKTYRILDHAVEQNQNFDNKVSLEINHVQNINCNPFKFNNLEIAHQKVFKDLTSWRSKFEIRFSSAN